MSLNIAEKLAKGESLSDEEVAYAVQHGIDLPEEYGEAVSQKQAETFAGAPTDGTPVFSTGAAFPSATGPGLFLTEEELAGLTNDTLRELGAAKGMELSGRKAAMVAELSGGADSGEESDEDEG